VSSTLTLATCTQDGSAVPDPAPTLNGLGGFGTDLSSLIANLRGVALETIAVAIACVIVLFVIGHAIHNRELARGANAGVIVVVIAGFLLGALPALANAGFGLGQTGGC
jgi:hypothetical protein